LAGIGFALRKLFREDSLSGQVRAYVYSSITTVGPMVLCMVMVLAMQQLMIAGGAPFMDRELYLTTVVYAFIFSVLITGGLSMLLTRFIADRMYEEKYEHLLSSYYGAIAVCLPIGFVAATVFLSQVEASWGYKIATYILFAELIVLWIQTVHLSALKDYARIVRHFAYGVVVAIAGTWLALRFTDWPSATAAIGMMAAGIFVVIWRSGRHFERTFPAKRSELYFSFLRYSRKYPSLLLIGTFFYSGVYSHSFVYWFSDGAIVADAYRISPLYDLPVFYAYLTIIPTLVTFVVSVETSFYTKYKNYYFMILNGGTFREVADAKKEMQRVLMQEISFVMQVQLLFTVVSLALGAKLLPMIGFTMQQLEIFQILTLGYFLFIMAFIVMLIMLYFDDRRGAAGLSTLLVVLNTGLTWWTKEAEFHGFGLFAASFLTLILALARLLYFVRNIDYYTFCSQPLVHNRKRPGKIAVLRARLLKVGMASLVVAMLAGCSTGNLEAMDPADAIAPAVTNGDKLVEDKRIYERDDDMSVKTMYVTVLPDKDRDGEAAPMTWYAMNRIRERAEEGTLDIIIQEGAANGGGPQSGMFGYGQSEANAKIALRGNTARFKAQRSYKINLKDSAGLWNDQKVLNLNKHILDPSRIRNKLSFDLFETLPDSASLRTQFVHLYVKDLSEGGESSNKPFEDYGLFTHIEQPNKQFLKNHWLDPNGLLYKAAMFEFFRYPDELKSESDPAYDPALFEKRLEIRGREEHGKLLDMLDAVNDYSIPIEQVIDKYFDLDNYLTWMAANILMDNMDTSAANYLLYSPLNSDKWYFIPWDYDGGWELQRRRNSIGEANSGISNYWGVVLHNRFLRIPANVQKLKDKIDELYESTINGSLEKRINEYRSVVEPFMARMPDRGFLPVSLREIDDQYQILIETPLRSIERFNEDMERPKPFFLGDFVQENGISRFTWEPSFDLQGDDLTYDFAIARDPLFTEIVHEQSGLTATSVDIEGLKAGTYYWRAIAKDEGGRRQIAFDLVFDDEGDPHYGMREIKVG